MYFFTPHSLDELVEDCCAPMNASASVISQKIRGLEFPIVGVMARRNAKLDRRQSSLFLDAAQGKIAISSLSDVLALASRIGPGSGEVRAEMAYAGAPIASLAKQVYAHHDSLPELLDSLVRVLGSGSRGDPCVFSALVGFYCLQLHPFLDGNGRWSRVLAAACGHEESVTDAFVGALFLSACKDDLVRDIWPHSRSYGLRKYVENVLEFRNSFVELIPSRVTLETRALLAAIDSIAKAPRAKMQLRRAIFALGQIDESETRSLLNISSKVARGFLEKAKREFPIYVDENESISIRSVCGMIEHASTEAGKSILNKEVAK